MGPNRYAKKSPPPNFRSVVSVRVNDLSCKTAFHDSTEELTGQRVRELVAIGVRGQWGGRFFKVNVADRVDRSLGCWWTRRKSGIHEQAARTPMRSHRSFHLESGQTNIAAPNLDQDCAVM